MRLIEGRDISWDDLSNNRNVVIINETVARKLWPGQDPIGRTAIAGGADAQVIGVIADVRESSAEDNAGRANVPARQRNSLGRRAAYLVVRSKLPPSCAGNQRDAACCAQINPGQPATEFKPIQPLVDHATSPRRFFVLLVGIFAGLGLLLASLGIYGVISYSVTRQTQEIGIRMALGATQSSRATRRDLEDLRLALVGIAIGSIASLGDLAPDRVSAFSDCSSRSANLCWDGGAAGSRRAAGGLSSRTKSFKDRPDGRSAEQLKSRDMV